MKKHYFAYFLLMVAVMMAGCDGSIGVKGNVYKMVNSKSISVAFIDNSIPNSEKLQPIEDAKITIYQVYDEFLENNDLIDSNKSDKDGYFHLGNVIPPEEIKVLLIVEKDGYKTLKKMFTHSDFDHKVLVILAPINE